MSDKDSSLNEDQENVETNDINLNNNEKKELEKIAFYKQLDMK